MKIYPFRAIFPDIDIVTSPASFVSDAKLHFKEYYEKGYFERLSREGYFVQRITTEKRSYIGICTNVDINEFLDKKALPHEKTLKPKEQISMQLLINRDAVIKPVLLCHKPIKELKDLIKQVIKKTKAQTTYHFELKNETHEYWTIFKPELVAKITDLFNRKIDLAFIADGHHRVKVLQHLYTRKKNKGNKYSRILTTFLDFEEIEILDYNRLIDIENNLSPISLIAALSNIGTIKKLDNAEKPKQKHDLTFCLEEEWFLFQWKKSIISKYEQNDIVLDHDVFNDLILNNVLGIENTQTDMRVKYLEGNLTLDQVHSKLAKAPHRVAFFLYPVQIEEIRQLAIKGLTLPPKSTFFIPRLYNALIADDLS